MAVAAAAVRSCSVANVCSTSGATPFDDYTFEAIDDDGHARELLAQVVVQVPRDSRAFILLGVDQAAAEVLVLLIRLAQRMCGASFLLDDNREQHQRSGCHQEE